MTFKPSSQELSVLLKPQRHVRYLSGNLEDWMAIGNASHSSLEFGPPLGGISSTLREMLTIIEDTNI